MTTATAKQHDPATPPVVSPPPEGPITAKEEKRRMPLMLKLVLARNGITQVDWAKHVQQAGGRPLSGTAATMLLNWNTWPKQTPREDIERQTVELLRRHGAPEEDIAIIWDIDEHDEGLFQRPSRNRDQKNGSPIPDINLPEVVMLSANAKKHHRLFKDPFVDDVQSPDDVFLDHDQRFIREAMYYAAKHGSFLAVIGESGSGKTTLRRDLLDRIGREGAEITVIQPRIIDKGRLSAGAICDSIISDVSQETARQSLEAKARQIERLLTGSSRTGRAHVLIIEEAHDLSIQTLKYLKRFWELEDGFRKLLGIILVGQPELKNKLDERQNWEAREVIRRCEIAELQPLNGNLEKYLELKFKRAGKALEELFAPDAFDALRERLTIRRRGTDAGISMIYPLVVNNAVTKALNLAADIGAPKVSAEIIREL